MKVLVIGTGAIGLNMANHLLDKNINFDIITSSNDNVSYNYPNAIVNKYKTNLKLDFPIFGFRKINLLWLVMAILSFPFHKKQKKIIINESKKILNYQFKNCYDNEFFDSKYIFNKLLERVQDKIIYKTINNDDINKYSLEYDKVYVCVGNSYNDNNYVQYVSSYKYYCECDNKPDCLIIENMFFIEPHEDNIITIKAHIIIGDNDKYFNYDHIYNKLKNSYIWDKYKITKVNKITKGTRVVSFDLLPYYINKNNICYITGGSFNGFIFAPYVTKRILENDKYFHISRLRNKILLVYLIVIIFVIIIFIHF